MTRDEAIDKLYHTQIRLAVSEKYKKCGEEIHQLFMKAERLSELLNSREGKNLPYCVYKDKMLELERYEEQLKEYKIRRDVWDQARDLCFDTADSVVRLVFGLED
jgi:hypothetical protein